MFQKTNIIIIVVISIIVFGCKYDETSTKEVTPKDTTKKEVINEVKLKGRDTTDFERIMINSGLIDIEEIDSTIKTDIRYSTTNNFLKIDMYGDYDRAYFQKEVADKILKAQKLLKEQKPNYSLVIFDGTRPRTIQKLMWDSINIPENQKYKYLANPKHISMHSYGLAVDLSIEDSTGNLIDMGTEYDSFKELAYPVLEDRMLKNGLLTDEQYQNRILLRNIMKEVGFNSISTEWWHFSIYDQKQAAKLFAAVETHIIPRDTTIYIAEVVKEIPIEKETDINITFKIQIKTSMKPLDINSDVFQKLPIYRYFHNGLYKYTTGNFKDLASAYEHRDKMKAMGYSDCFVAGFNNDERIGIKNAVELAN